jgi:hypothetical protein
MACELSCRGIDLIVPLESANPVVRFFDQFTRGIVGAVHATHKHTPIYTHVTTADKRQMPHTHVRVWAHRAQTVTYVGKMSTPFAMTKYRLWWSWTNSCKARDCASRLHITQSCCGRSDKTNGCGANNNIIERTTQSFAKEGKWCRVYGALPRNCLPVHKQKLRSLLDVDGHFLARTLCGGGGGVQVV